MTNTQANDTEASLPLNGAAEAERATEVTAAVAVKRVSTPSAAPSDADAATATVTQTATALGAEASSDEQVYKAVAVATQEAQAAAEDTARRIKEPSGLVDNQRVSAAQETQEMPAAPVAAVTRSGILAPSIMAPHLPSQDGGNGWGGAGDGWGGGTSGTGDSRGGVGGGGDTWGGGAVAAPASQATAKSSGPSSPKKTYIPKEAIMSRWGKDHGSAHSSGGGSCASAGAGNGCEATTLTEKVSSIRGTAAFEAGWQKSTKSGSLPNSVLTAADSSTLAAKPTLEQSAPTVSPFTPSPSSAQAPQMTPTQSNPAPVASAGIMQPSVIQQPSLPAGGDGWGGGGGNARGTGDGWGAVRGDTMLPQRQSPPPPARRVTSPPPSSLRTASRSPPPPRRRSPISRPRDRDRPRERSPHDRDRYERKRDSSRDRAKRSASPLPRHRGPASPDRYHLRSGHRKDQERSMARKDSRVEADAQRRSQFVRSPSGSPVTPPPCTTTWRGPLLKSGVLLAELEGAVAAPDGCTPVLNWTVPSDLHVTMYSGGSNMEQQIKLKVNLKAQELWDNKLLVLTLPAGAPQAAVTGFAKLIASLHSKGKAAVVKLYELWDREKPKDDHMVLYGMLLKKQIVAAGVVTAPFGNSSPTTAGAAASSASRPGAPTHGRRAATATPLHGVPSAQQQRGGPTTPRDAAEPRHSHISNLIQQPSSSNSYGNAGTSSNVLYKRKEMEGGGRERVFSKQVKKVLGCIQPHVIQDNLASEIPWGSSEDPNRNPHGIAVVTPKSPRRMARMRDYEVVIQQDPHLQKPFSNSNSNSKRRDSADGRGRDREPLGFHDGWGRSEAEGDGDGGNDRGGFPTSTGGGGGSDHHDSGGVPRCHFFDTYFHCKFGRGCRNAQAHNCQACGAADAHNTRNCPKNGGSGDQVDRDGHKKCYKCGHNGHIARDCTQGNDRYDGGGRRDPSPPPRRAATTPGTGLGDSDPPPPRRKTPSPDPDHW